MNLHQCIVIYYIIYEIICKTMKIGLLESNDLLESGSHLKGPFRDLQPHPPIFSKKVKKFRFLHQQKPLGTQCLPAKYFLHIHCFEK